MEKTIPFVTLVLMVTAISLCSTFSCKFHHPPVSRWQLQYQRQLMDSINAWSENTSVIVSPSVKNRMKYIKEHLYFSDIQTIDQKDSTQLILIPFDETFDSLCREEDSCAEVLILWNKKGKPITRSGIACLKPFKETFSNSATGMAGGLFNNEHTYFTGSMTFTKIDGTIEFEKHFSNGELVSQKTIRSRPLHPNDTTSAPGTDKGTKLEWYEVNTTYTTITYTKDSMSFLGIGDTGLSKIHRK